MKISFVIPGKPTGKGRPKFFRRGNFVGTYTPEKTASYENLVKVIFMEAAAKSSEWKKADRETPIRATISCWTDVPASWSKKKKMAAIWNTKKPDSDNVAKIILDALNGLAFEDDSQVVALDVQKRYGSGQNTTVRLDTELNYE